jgi:NADPH-dependent 2,4-dienoyl-CoA reductase/sulfur reductase-like enzyme
VHVLRTLDDSRALRDDLRPGARLVVVGAGFIGSEVASTARALGLDVTVVEVAPTPLAGPLGVEMGAVISALHAANGVTLICGIGVAGFAGTDRVTGVELADGRVLPADVVVVGVGAAPNVEWLAGSGLTVANGVICNAFGGTGAPGVVAVGDCATWFDPSRETHHRYEHWTGARENATTAAAWLLSGGTDERVSRAPYVWSDQYGRSIRLAGYVSGFDDVTVEAGDPATHEFLAVYRAGGRPTGALAIGHNRLFMGWRKYFAEVAAGQRPETEPTGAPR